MKEEYKEVVQIIAESIIEVVRSEETSLIHYLETDDYADDLPTDADDRLLVIEKIVSIVQDEFPTSDVYIDENDYGNECFVIDDDPDEEFDDDAYIDGEDD